MDRNSIIGLSLIFAIIIGYAWMSQPTEAEIKLLQHQQDSALKAGLMQDSLSKVQAIEQQKEKLLLATDSNAAANRYGAFGKFVNGSNEFYTLENKELLVKISAKGGRVHSVTLKNYKRADKVTPVTLFEGTGNQFDYTFTTFDGKILSTEDLYFTPDQKNVNVTEGQSGSITLSIPISEKQSIKQVYSLQGDGFVMGYDLQLNGMHALLAPGTKHIVLNWKNSTPFQEKSVQAEQRASTIYYEQTDETVDYLAETKDEEKALPTPVRWVSFKQQFFNSTLISDKPFEQVTIESHADQSGRFVKKYTASLGLPFGNTGSENYKMKFFYGPNHYKTLEALNINLEKIIPLGWLIFRWVNKYIVINLFHFLSQIFSNYGIIILLMTVIIKIFLFPLVYRSFLSTAKMRLLKPEMDEIKEKFGDDMQKVQMENMKLFKQAGVSPMGGCMPILLQMPFLIAMFAFFPSAFELRQQEFLWATDLSSYDTIWTFGKYPIIEYIYGDHVSLFTLLMTISTLIYTHLNNQMTGVTGQMKWIGYMMPIVFLGVFNNYAAGLSYYYFVSNMITFGQQWGIRQFVDEKKLHAQIQENKKKPVQKSKFQQRLEDMAKVQEKKKPVKK
ncbi:MAG: membrane protein insertase YidC [Bacteroidia bacterium]